MKKVVLATALLLSFSNTSFSQYQIVLDNTGKLYNPASISQFDGITINGKTAQQALDEAYNKALSAANASLENAYKEHNEKIAKYNALTKEDEQLSNITARLTNTIHSNPSEFIRVGDAYVHWLSNGMYEDTCKHYSYEEMQRHTAVHESRIDLYWSIVNEKDSLERKGKTAGREAYVKCINEALTPFIDIKVNELRQKADDLHMRIKDYNCREPVGQKLETNVLGALLGGPSQRVANRYCKEFNRCHFRAGLNKNNMVDIICDCGHPVESHKYKLNKE